MTWLTEDPTMLVILGIAALAVLFVVLMKTGRGIVLIAMLGVALLTIAAVIIERVIVTDRELIEDTIHAAAHAAERNDLDGVVSYFAPQATALKQEAKHWIGQATIESVRISDLKVTLNPLTIPPTGIAEFNVVGQGRLKIGTAPYNNFAGRIVVTLEQHGDQWQVSAYERRGFGGR